MDELLKELRNLLAKRYSDIEDAKRIVRDASLNPALIKSDTLPVNYWQNILDNAWYDGRMAKLLETVKAENSGWTEFDKVFETYEQVLKQQSENGQTSLHVAGKMLPSQPLSVFFSYSHADETLRDKLAKHLSVLQRDKVIQTWHDRRISAGTEWAGQIDDNLNSADIILLLISDDFLASDYCYDVELKRAMERHEEKTARVIPVILRAVDWQGAEFRKLQALPKDARPITSWTNQDEAFADVAKGIRNAVTDIKNKRQDQPPQNPR